jgi:hypothetical protein
MLYKPNNLLNVKTVAELPTIFMAETTNSGAQFARVGRIVNLHSNGKNWDLEYAYDVSIPPIANRKLAEMARDLDMDEWEFHRTHWAVKDVNLFEVLLRSNLSRPAPKVFTLSGEPADEKLIAVMMPFDTSFKPVYEALAEAARATDGRCQRADDIWKRDTIIQDIVHLIETASVVICDISRKNPNVFYEAGIAHSLGKDVILITQNEEDVPFNLRHLRHIRYLNNGEGLEKLSKAVRDRIRTLQNSD